MEKIEIDENEVELILFALVRAHHTTTKHDELEDKLIKWKNNLKKPNNANNRNR